MVKAGMVYCKTQPGKSNLYGAKDLLVDITFYKESDADRRVLPRLCKKYVDLGKLSVEVLEEQNRPLDSDKIFELVMVKIKDLKKQINRDTPFRM